MTFPMDFSKLDDARLDQWAAALGEILLEADAAMRSGDGARRKAVRTALKDFMDWNQYKSLDQLASGALSDIASASLDEALSSIASRTAQVQRIEADARKSADAAVKDAATLRGEAIVRVIDATTESVKAFKQLQDAIEGDAGASQLVEDLRQLIAKTQALRNAVETA